MDTDGPERQCILHGHVVQDRTRASTLDAWLSREAFGTSPQAGGGGTMKEYSVFCPILTRTFHCERRCERSPAPT